MYGVEIIPQAIDDAMDNAKINGIENVEFFVGKAEEVLPSWYQEHAVSGTASNGERARACVGAGGRQRKGGDAALLGTNVEM